MNGGNGVGEWVAMLLHWLQTHHSGYFLDCVYLYVDYHVSAPSVNQVFTVDFEVKPLYVEADYSLNLNVQPVEIVYDEVSV